MSLYLGIKTGKYTTSAALFDSGKEVVLLVSYATVRREKDERSPGSFNHSA